MTLQILGTGLDGTRAALAAARTMASGLDARVVVLVPHVVPYGEALAHPTVKPALVGARYATLADELSIEADIRICVCRSWSADLATLLSRDAPVVVGGDTRRWFPTREQRLAASLVGKGYDVLLVAASAPPVEVSRASGGQGVRRSHIATARRWSPAGR
jgi:hypothetical protein